MIAKHPYKIVRNTSAFSLEVLVPLLDLAWEIAWTGRTPYTGVVYAINITSCRHLYRGRAWSKRCLLRLGNPAHHQKQQWPVNVTYPRFKDMPEYYILDWHEAIVHLAAHEFAHLCGAVGVSYSGRRTGEEMCELVAWDALDAYRKRREEIEAKIAKNVAAVQTRAAKNVERERSTKLLRTSTEYKLGRLDALEAAWQRKLKLATTKLRKINRSRSALLAAQKRKQNSQVVQLPGLQQPEQQAMAACPPTK